MEWDEHRELRQEYVYKETPFFSTKHDLAQRQGKYKKRRLNYLQQLVTEFQDIDDQGWS